MVVDPYVMGIITGAIAVLVVEVVAMFAAAFCAVVKEHKNK